MQTINEMIVNYQQQVANITGKKPRFIATFTSFDNETGLVYYINLATKTEVEDFFKAMVAAPFKGETNFGGNPYESAAFIKLKIQDNVSLAFCGLTAKNGDSNWYSYGEDFGYMVEAIINVNNEG